MPVPMLPSLSSLDNSFLIAIAAFLACIGSDGTPVTFTFNSLTTTLDGFLLPIGVISHHHQVLL